MRSADFARTDMRRSGRAGRAALSVSALALLGALAAGCSTTGTSDVDLADYDHRLRHPIMISNDPEVLDIPVGMSGPAVSPAIERAIGDYVAGYRQDGTGALAIQVPSGSANEGAAAATGRAVHYALVRAGVPRGQIQVVPYHVGDYSRAASLRLSYLRVKAVTPRCGVWPERSPNTNRNSQYENFGCAAQQNLAAMVADPAHLVRPEPMDPANGARRAKVITDYSQGQETKSATTLIESDFGGGE